MIVNFTSFLYDDTKSALMISRIQVDFVLDWTKHNHCETVIMALAYKYNVFHYKLPKVHFKYGTHEKAISGGTLLAEKLV